MPRSLQVVSSTETDREAELIQLQRTSAVESLRQMIVIIGGLSLTNALIVLVTQGNYETIHDPLEFGATYIASFLLLVSLIIRFYHGNFRLIDDVYTISDKTGRVSTWRRDSIARDFLAVFLTSLLFAAMSFYLAKPMAFSLIFFAIVFFDIIWLCSTIKRKDIRDLFQDGIGSGPYYVKWLVNNIVFVIAFLIAVAVLLVLDADLSSGDENSKEWIAYTIVYFLILLNTIADYVVSWQTYFPRKSGV